MPLVIILYFRGVYFLIDNEFPLADKADKNGLLAVGGDLNAETLLKAYRLGIFPWYNPDEPILWWSPDPRMVLYPEKVYCSKSMKQIMKRGIFSFSKNVCFEEVMRQCREQRLAKQGTWISEEMIEAYTKLQTLGHALSIEVWQDQQLAGGLYGVVIGKCFFGESMFSLVSNASKAALIFLCEHLITMDFKLIDCQVANSHLESMGAESVPRKKFLEELGNAINQ